MNQIQYDHWISKGSSTIIDGLALVYKDHPELFTRETIQPLVDAANGLKEIIDRSHDRSDATLDVDLIRTSLTLIVSLWTYRLWANLPAIKSTALAQLKEDRLTLVRICNAVAQKDG